MTTPRSNSRKGSAGSSRSGSRKGSSRKGGSNAGDSKDSSAHGDSNALATAGSAFGDGDAVAAAEMALSMTNYEQAIALLKAHLGQHSNDTAAMDLLAQSLMESGQSEEAYAVLQKSTSLAPHASSLKWLYLGQLQEGLDALQSFGNGINVMTQEAKAAKERVCALPQSQ